MKWTLINCKKQNSRGLLCGKNSERFEDKNFKIRRKQQKENMKKYTNNIFYADRQVEKGMRGREK